MEEAVKQSKKRKGRAWIWIAAAFIVLLAAVLIHYRGVRPIVTVEYGAFVRAEDFTARELQVPIFRGGELVYDLPALEEIRAYCAAQLATLWPEVKRFENPHGYYIDLSEELMALKDRMLSERGRAGRKER